jgi:hypothetical protein
MRCTYESKDCRGEVVSYATSNGPVCKAHWSEAFRRWCKRPGNIRRTCDWSYEPCFGEIELDDWDDRPCISLCRWHRLVRLIENLAKDFDLLSSHEAKRALAVALRVLRPENPNGITLSDLDTPAPMHVARAGVGMVRTCTCQACERERRG